MSVQNPKRLVDALPELAEELKRLFVVKGEKDLAEQVFGLTILERCPCKDDFCSTFYVLPKPKGSYGPGHHTIDLLPDRGMILVDVCNGRIACIEVLYRDEVRQKLQTLFPI